MLSTFYYWAEDAIPKLPAGIDAHLTPGRASSNTSARLDFDTPARVGRITCWDSGSFYAEILDVESGREVFDLHGSFDSAASLTVFLHSFLEKLAAAQN